MDFGLLYENDTGEYVVLNDVRIADIRLASLVYLFVYVSTNCVPIAHLRQNKPFPLLYLGHAQIINCEKSDKVCPLQQLLPHFGLNFRKPPLSGQPLLSAHLANS